MRPAAAEDVDERDVGQLHLRGRHADQHHRAGQVAGVERLLPRLGPTDRLHHHVGALGTLVVLRADLLDGRHRVERRDGIEGARAGIRTDRIVEGRVTKVTVIDPGKGYRVGLPRTISGGGGTECQCIANIDALSSVTRFHCR